MAVSSWSEPLQEWINAQVLRLERERPHHVMSTAYWLSHQYGQADSDAGVAQIDVLGFVITVTLRADATVRQINDWAMRLRTLELHPIPDHSGWMQSLSRYNDVPVCLVAPANFTDKGQGS